MKFEKERVLSMENVNNCYALPKELLTREYSKYSLKSKLLFSIVITEADNGTSVSELAELIEKIGARNISTIHKKLHKEMAVHQSGSEV